MIPILQVLLTLSRGKLPGNTMIIKKAGTTFHFEQKQDNLVQINVVLSAALLTQTQKEESRKVETTTSVIMKALQNSTLPTFRTE
jgi:hypothetical protein